jgi:hypothetical protein
MIMYMFDTYYIHGADMIKGNLYKAYKWAIKEKHT